MTTARLYCSGLNFTYNPHRLLLNKVTDVYLSRTGSAWSCRTTSCTALWQTFTAGRC